MGSRNQNDLPKSVAQRKLATSHGGKCGTIAMARASSAVMAMAIAAIAASAQMAIGHEIGRMKAERRLRQSSAKKPITFRRARSVQGTRFVLGWSPSLAVMIPRASDRPQW